MSIILAEEELLKIGRVYSSDDEEEKEREDLEKEPDGTLDDDLLSGVGLDDGLFEDEEEEDDPFVAGDDPDDDEE
jgi:hypothetical protein